jgi:hypothetical protein
MGLTARYCLGMGADADSKPLHGDPRFDTLLAHTKEVAEQKAN